MEDKTKKDLEDIRSIKESIKVLERSMHDIMSACQCLDYVVISEESLKYDVCPRAVCPVCGKSSSKTPTLQEKIECFKDHLCRGDDSDYSEEEFIAMAIAGGFNYPSYLR